MNRRQYLAGATSTIAGAGLLAGCVDDGGLDLGENADGDDEDGSDAPNDGESTNGSSGGGGDGTGGDAGGDDAGESDGNREVERAIKRAVGQLNKAALSLTALNDRLDDPEGIEEFDADEPRERIATGRDHFETAAEAATGDRQADVEAIRAYADVLEAMVEVTASLTDTDYQADVDAVRSAMTERRLEEARSIVADRRDVIAGDRETLEPTLETLETIDRERLAELDAADIGDVESGVETVDAALWSLSTLTDAFGTILDGYERLDAGQTRVDDREYEDAVSAFEDARDRFDAATASLEDAREDVVDGLTGYVDTTLCQSRGLADAAGLFVEAGTAALDGALADAQETRDEAREALAEAERCGA